MYVTSLMILGGGRCVCVGEGGGGFQSSPSYETLLVMCKRFSSKLIYHAVK